MEFKMGNSTIANYFRTLWPLLLFGMMVSCDETFPPYREPEAVLQPEVTLTAPDTIQLFLDGVTGTYYLNTPMVLKVVVTNVHDDLLQGRARVQGSITLYSFSQIPRTMTVPLTTGNLRTPPVFQGNIAIAPGARAELQELWIPYATDGRIVFEGLPSVPGTGGSLLYGPIDFRAFAEVQLFEKVQAIRSPEISFVLAFNVTQ